MQSERERWIDTLRRHNEQEGHVLMPADQYAADLRDAMAFADAHRVAGGG